MTVITSTIIENGSVSRLRHPSVARAGFFTTTEESKMRKFWKLGVPAATLVVAATLGAINANRAQAGEYCRTDVTGHMTSCGFDTMDQCKAAASGIGGDCFRDPNLPSTASNGDNRNSFAYQPNRARPAHQGRYGRAASPD
jgi:hypothetical protein